MIRKLRKKHHFSQEQLATLTGLSLRTIQRIESGNSASLETLKSLAAVFEVEIELLKGEISVIDKETEEWGYAPLWVRFSLWGIRDRKVVIRWEIASLITGVLCFTASLSGNFQFIGGTALLGAAYFYAVTIRWVDNKSLWK